MIVLDCSWGDGGVGVFMEILLGIVWYFRSIGVEWLVSGWINGFIGVVIFVGLLLVICLVVL